MKNILKLENISKSFNNTEVLKDITLDIERGKIISLLGKSGSGKTTLLNIIAGFEKSDSGMMTLDNKILFDKHSFVEPQKRNIGFVFQNYALFPHLNIFENITFGVDYLPNDEKVKISKRLLKLVHLEGIEKKYPFELSGGQQQRVALIRAMALNPDLILFDEPFSSIDTLLKNQIQKELLLILRASHKSAIIVTHDPNEAMAISDKIVYLEDGKIVQYDTPMNIYRYPKTKRVATSFAIANFINKNGVEYGFRPNDCVIDTKGEYKVNLLNKVYQGDKFILEVEFEGNIFMLYSLKDVDEENIFLTILWDNAFKI